MAEVWRSLFVPPSFHSVDFLARRFGVFLIFWYAIQPYGESFFSLCAATFQRFLGFFGRWGLWHWMTAGLNEWQVCCLVFFSVWLVGGWVWPEWSRRFNGLGWYGNGCLLFPFLRTTMIFIWNVVLCLAMMPKTKVMGICSGDCVYVCARVFVCVWVN